MKKVLKYLLYLGLISIPMVIILSRLGLLGTGGVDPCRCLTDYYEWNFYADSPTYNPARPKESEKILAFRSSCIEVHMKKAGDTGTVYINYLNRLCNDQKATQYDSREEPEEGPEVTNVPDEEIKKIIEGIQNRNSVKTVTEDEVLTDNIYEDEVIPEEIEMETEYEDENIYDTEQNIDQEMETETDFYIIAVSVTSDENEASEMVAELKSQGYNSNFLWIPDYKSLSGAKFYSVYIGPFNDINECANEVEKYRKIKPDAYALLVSNSSEQRVEIRGPGKIRKQELIN